MKFEIHDDLNNGTAPWPGAVLERLHRQVVRFLPLEKNTDGTPVFVPASEGSQGHAAMCMIGRYANVLVDADVWTLEIGTLDDLLDKGRSHRTGQLFDEIHILPSTCPECVGILHIEEPTSVPSSYS